MPREPIRPPELSELEVFVLAVEEGSIARAAGRLQISPPAASKRIRHLEALAHDQLLVRGARGVVATETGARLYPIAREALAQRTRFVDAILGAPSTDPLRIAGMHRMLGHAEVPPPEELFKGTEAILAAIFHATADAILLIGAEDGLVYEINDSAARLTGYHQDEMRGMTVLQAALWEEPERCDECVRAAIISDQPQHAELVLRTRAGHRRLVAARFDVIKLRGRVYLLVTLQDVWDVLAAVADGADDRSVSSVSSVSNGSNGSNNRNGGGDRGLADLYLVALRDGSEPAAQAVARKALAAGLDLADVHARLIEPAMRSIGDLWERREISVADEHLATAISQDVAARILMRSRQARPRSRERVLMAAVEGEEHVLGLRLATDVLDSAGFDTLYLGADLPIAALVDACLIYRPAVLGLTVSIEDNAPTLLRTVVELTRMMPDLQVIVGGRAAAAAAARGLAASVVEHSGDMLSATERLTAAPAV